MLARFLNKILTKDENPKAFRVLQVRNEACVLSGRVKRKPTQSREEMKMYSNSVRSVFESTEFFEAVEGKATEQLQSLSEALFKLYEANSEKMSREILFRIVEPVK